ncbi:MAG: helix-turn-helix domain-containing protein [Nitrososphaera sp.]
MSNPPAQAYLSPRDVAQITGLGISTVRKYIRDRTIPARKLGGRWLISTIALQTLLDAGENRYGIDAATRIVPTGQRPGRCQPDDIYSTMPSAYRS